MVGLARATKSLTISDCRYCRLSKTHECDGQTDGQTDID